MDKGLEKVLKNMYVRKRPACSVPCLHTLILTQLSTNKSAEKLSCFNIVSDVQADVLPRRVPVVPGHLFTL